ncbi:MAG: hypothetical protein PHY54_17385 [Methylococcales bacterium]|nr:hypothetical protein [Methylococcales bacterium]
MKRPSLLVLFFIISFFTIGSAKATEHHSGHGSGAGGGGGSSAGSCGKPQLGKFLPPHLATVEPGSGFSFRAFNIDKPEQIAVTVKNIPVETTAEFKDPYYVIKGKLPASLVDTAARINIKVSAKSPHCEAENGWLLKISGK